MTLSSALMFLAPIPAAFVAGLRGQSKDEDLKTELDAPPI